MEYAAVGALALGTYYYRKNAVFASPRYDSDSDSNKWFSESIPILGCLPYLSRNLKGIDKYFAAAIQHSEEPILASIPFTNTFLMIMDAESLKHVTHTNFEKYEKGSVLSSSIYKVFGHGIFNSDGEQWYWQRKLASRAFTTGRFRQNIETVFAQKMQTVLSIMDSHARSGEILDIQDILFRFFMDSFGEIAFGTDLRSLKYAELPFVQSFDRCQAQMSRMFFDPFLKLYNNKFPGSFDRDTKLIRNFAKDLIREKRYVDSDSGSGENNLLSLFLSFTKENGDKVTDDELVDQVINFIIAGRDTTANALTWLFYELACNPKVAEKVVEEVIEVTGSADKMPNYDQVKEMKYAKAVFDETLRLHPSVCREGKECIADDVLPNGMEVKKGTFVCWDPYAFGRNPRIFDDPHKFNPDRFLNHRYSQYEYPVFNCGPRICLGKSLAEIQGVFFTACVLQRYRVDPIDLTGVDFVFTLTNPMDGGLFSKIEARD